MNATKTTRHWQNRRIWSARRWVFCFRIFFSLYFLLFLFSNFRRLLPTCQFAYEVPFDHLADRKTELNRETAMQATKTTSLCVYLELMFPLCWWRWLSLFSAKRAKNHIRFVAGKRRNEHIITTFLVEIIWFLHRLGQPKLSQSSWLRRETLFVDAKCKFWSCDLYSKKRHRFHCFEHGGLNGAHMVRC